MKEYMILGVTADRLELPTLAFSSYKEMARTLGITLEQSKMKVHKKRIDRELNLKFLKVKISIKSKKESEKEQNNTFL